MSAVEKIAYMWLFGRVPLSTTFGRRLVLLLSTLISIASMIWRAEAKSYSSFMGAAILAGIGTGPGEVERALPFVENQLNSYHHRRLFHQLLLLM